MRNILLLTCLIFIISCSSNKRKEELTKNFVDMRIVPSSILTIKKIDNYEIGYQDKSDLSERYNYPNNYVIGTLDESKKEYKYVTYIENLSPLENYDYVKSILKLFESDSTQIRTIILDENSNIRANVYRKTTNHSVYDFEWAMWKWIKTKNGQLIFETEKLMNEHLFE